MRFERAAQTAAGILRGNCSEKCYWSKQGSSKYVPRGNLFTPQFVNIYSHFQNFYLRIAYDCALRFHLMKEVWSFTYGLTGGQSRVVFRCMREWNRILCVTPEKHRSNSKCRVVGYAVPSNLKFPRHVCTKWASSFRPTMNSQLWLSDLRLGDVLVVLIVIWVLSYTE